ncbi:MAG TPA: hypothetical protein VIQ24_11755 [Pyrinomonadaceae bacterium]
MKKTLISVLCLIAALAVLAFPAHGQRRRSPGRPTTQAKPLPPKESITNTLPDGGSVKDGVYTNEYFGLEFIVPEGWRVADEESRRQLNRQASEVMAGDSKDMQKLLRRAEGQTINLFTIAKFLPPESDGRTVTMRGAAEPVQTWLFKTGEEYLGQVRRILERTAVKPEYDGPVTKEIIGGVEFATMHLRMNYYGAIVKQKLSVTIRKGHAIILTKSYLDEEGAQVIEEVAKTIKFK